MPVLDHLSINHHPRSTDTAATCSTHRAHVATMPTNFTAFKFIGTISLGLLTARAHHPKCSITSLMHQQGVSYTLSSLSLPALLSLPSAKPAAHTFTQLCRNARAHRTALTWLSAGAMLLAYSASPRRARHPYLLWTAAGVVANNYAYEAMPGSARTALEAKTSEKNEDTELNGEMVESAVKEAQNMEIARTFTTGLAFLMAVVGLWGDGA